MSITRREFLKWAGVAGLSTLLPPVFDRDMKAFAELPPGEGYYLPTGTRYSRCGTCDGNCGLILYMVGDTVREILGNPADIDGGRGDICVKSQSAMRNLYDPDLLKWPMKRTNPNKGKDDDPGFVKISWDEANTLIADKMKEAINSVGPRSIVVLARPVEPDRHFIDSIGTPNQLCHVDTCYLTNDVNAYATFGGAASRTLATEDSTYIICFGYDMPGKSKMPQLKSFLEAWDKGAKIVVFDPRLSTTASMADEWWAIRPGTDLAVVLAMINVIINENLYDADFVSKYCHGFTDLKNHVNARGYTPEWAEAVSDIPASEIRRIAREFATSERPFVPLYKRDAAGPNYANSDGLVRAIYILNSIVGSIERPGGYYWKARTQGMPPSLHDYAASVGKPWVNYPEVDGTARVDGQHLFPYVNTVFGKSRGAQTGYKSKGNFSHLADGLRRARLGEPFPDGTPSYPVKVVIASRYNTTSFPNMDRVVEELSNPEIFIAVADMYPNNIAWLADVVLPDTYWLESSNTSETTNQHAIRERLYLMDGVGATFERKGKGGIFNGILQKLWPDQFNVDWTGLTRERMKQFAISKGIGSSWEDLRNWLRTHNGIWQNMEVKPNYSFNTPSGKIELYSQKFAAAGHEPLPTWQPKLVERGHDELYILVNHHPWHRMCRNCNDPLINDLQPENFLHIHPDVANQFGVKTGDYVWVEARGVFRERLQAVTRRMRVKVIKGIRPDTAMTEHGFGNYSRLLSVAYNKGVNDGDLLADRTSADSLTRFVYNPSMGNHILDNVIAILGKA
jgi:thiosulfate reductase / polysulfide reductase chain A